MPPNKGDKPGDDKFEALLDYLKLTRGFDFTAYKRSSLMRRVNKRMQTINIENFEAYVDYLEVHPEEFGQLFNTILINVTSFFRDQTAWDYLAAEIIPRILNDKEADETVRIWSAGCAAGQEAYSLAILFAEAMGPEAFQKRVKIYASDVDQDALAHARAASYTEAEIEAVRPEWREKYFVANAGRYVFRNDLRRLVIFGRHDLVQDAPISRLDLLACRNTLMYLNAEMQTKILARFHFALNETGFLFLGRAELLLTQAGLFKPVELQHRVFYKVPRVNLRDRMLVMAQAGDVDAVEHLGRHVRLREAAFNNAPVAQLVVDMGGTVILINEPMRSRFGLEPRDVGRPLQDLEISYRPCELRSLIERARTERRTVTLPNVEHRMAGGEVLSFNVEVNLLLHNGESPLGVSIAFIDVTGFQRLQSDLQRSNQELETTNEELQSTNEELETMNEELQSTNEELETINTELRQRTAELDSTNLFLHSILRSLLTGVVVVDQEMRVVIWNYFMEDMWGLRADEVFGKPLVELDLGLPVQELERPVRSALSGKANNHELVLDARNRRGKSLQCIINISPLTDGTDRSISGAVLVMSSADTVETSHQAALAAEHKQTPGKRSAK